MEFRLSAHWFFHQGVKSASWQLTSFLGWGLYRSRLCWGSWADGRGGRWGPGWSVYFENHAVFCRKVKGFFDLKLGARLKAVLPLRVPLPSLCRCPRPLHKPPLYSNSPAARCWKTPLFFECGLPWLKILDPRGEDGHGEGGKEGPGQRDWCSRRRAAGPPSEFPERVPLYRLATCAPSLRVANH